MSSSLLFLLLICTLSCSQLFLHPTGANFLMSKLQLIDGEGLSNGYDAMSQLFTRRPNEATNCMESCETYGQLFKMCGVDQKDHLINPSIPCYLCMYQYNMSALWPNTCQCPNDCMDFFEHPQGKCMESGIHRNDRNHGDVAVDDGNRNWKIEKKSCACHDGWTGIDCSLVQCPENTCNGRGKCMKRDNTTFSDYCQCEKGYLSGPNFACIAKEEKFVDLPFGELVHGENPYTEKELFGDHHPIFNLSRVAAIYIEMDEKDLKEMLFPPNYKVIEDKRVNFWFDNGMIREHMEDVGIKLKGHFSLLGLKKAFKFRFNKFGHKGRKFFNMKSLGIKASSLDNSQLKSWLPYDLLRSLIVPTQRSSFTTLWINKRFYGVYWMAEEYDDMFLKSRYEDSAGALYRVSGGCLDYRGDDPEVYKNQKQGNEYAYSQKSGDGTFQDLVQLVKVLNMSAEDPSFEDEVKNTINLDILARSLAVSQLLSNGDAFFNCNNMMLYYNPKDKRFEFLIYDFELIMPTAASVLNPIIPPLFTLSKQQAAKVFKLEIFRKKLETYVSLLLKKAFGLKDHVTRIRNVLNMIEPLFQKDRFYNAAQQRTLYQELTTDANNLIAHIQARSRILLSDM